MIDRLLGIEQLRPGGAGVEFGWAMPMPAWVWLVFVVAAVLLGVLSYRRVAGPLAWRCVLAGCRSALVLLLAVLLSGPQLTRANDRTEQDWVLVLADRSRSMTIADGAAGLSRDDELADAAAALSPALRDLADERGVLTYGFGAGAFPIDLLAEPGPALGEPDGLRTFLGGAVDTALSRVAARPVAGVIVLSDGASSDEVSRRALRRLRSERVPVHVVPLGSAEPLSDLAIAGVSAPSAAFVRDRIPVRVQIDRMGPPPGGETAVEIVDERTARVLDSRPVVWDADGDGPTTVTLSAQADEAGDAAWRVRLVSDAPDVLGENNTAPLRIELVDRPLRVVHADGYPRWEFRYVKNLLLRERSIESGSLLLATGRRSIAEGDLPLDRLPSSSAEWEPFDVIVLGDVRAEMLSESQMEQIREHVSGRGAGLLWIAGPSATPQSWRNTPLEALLPVRLSSGPAAWNQAVTMRREPAAERLGLLNLADPGAAGDPSRADAVAGWPDRLSDPVSGWSLLRYAQRFEPDAVKPTASVLASFVPISGEEPSPAVLSMRYGAGRVLYVGTDEIWRWRYARGEALPERFWIPLLRQLARERLSLTGRSAALVATPNDLELGASSVVSLTLLDARLAEAAPSTLTATATVADGDLTVELVLEPDPAAEGPPRYETVWTPPAAGRWTVSTRDPALAGERFEAGVWVFTPDDERRRADTDHDRLMALADETGGRVLTRDDLGSLNELFPNRSRQIAGQPDIDALWDSPAALLLITLLLGFEWIGRRLMRLA
ncbi:MAG: hypothetical protein AAGF47_05430 [Planctomycetota bacterium]